MVVELRVFEKILEGGKLIKKRGGQRCGNDVDWNPLERVYTCDIHI